MSDLMPVPFAGLILWLPRAVFDAALTAAMGSAANAQPGPPPVGPEWLTTERLAELSGLMPGHLRAQARAGLLEHRKVGRRYLFRRNAIDALGGGVTALSTAAPDGVVPWKR